MSKKQAPKKGSAKSSFFCKLCDKKIRMPQGWTRGPAVRRHYWKQHPEIMQPDGKKAGR